MKKIVKILLFILLIVLILGYTMIIYGINGDELWNYGFGYSIFKGLVPYRDFNLLVTPLWPFLMSVFIKIFGNYLFSIHLLNAIVTSLFFYISYKMLDRKVLVLIPIMLLVVVPTYNIFCIFLFSLFIYIKFKKLNNYWDSILAGLVISLLFLTKQTIGGVLFLVELIYTRDKKRYIISFTIPVLILFIYLIKNEALFDFINYSFLGLIDFAGKNTNISICFYMELILFTILIILFIKYKYPEFLYALAFQVVTVPLFDTYHIFLGLVISLLVILLKIDYKSFRTKYFIIMGLVLLFLTSFSDFDLYLSKDNNFLKGRNIGYNTSNMYNLLTNYVNSKKNIYDKIYIFSYEAYVVKINTNINIDKFDLILNGNMGYNGYKRYIEEIDNYCKNNSCLFIVDNTERKFGDQTNMQILDYVKNKYKLLENFYAYDIFVNDFYDNI